MTRSTIPTEYILIKAETNAQFACCDYAIIQITADWQNTMLQRTELAEKFKGIPYFSRVSFYDCPLGFFENDENVQINKILNSSMEDWAFIRLEENELERLTECDNQLNSFVLRINEYGYAFYSAYAEYTGEEYYTTDFNIRQMIYASITNRQ